MRITGVEHVEFFVDAAGQAAAQLARSYGFVPDAQAQPHRHGEDAISRCLRAGDAKLVITASERPDHAARRWVQRHGDGIADIALSTPDAARAFERAVAGGARPVKEPTARYSAHGSVVEAAISGFGDVVHTLVEHRPDTGALPLGPAPSAEDASGMRGIDHFAVCLPAGQLGPTARFYLDVLGFELLYEEEIILGSQGMNSQVVRNEDGNVTFTLIEPVHHRAPGQVDAFLQANGGAGVQHVAFLTDDILQSVRQCGRQGVRFLSTPAGYYARMKERFVELEDCMELFRESNVLMDRDESGYMFQIFTRSTHERRTLFFELIQRIGAKTFGSSNIKALYESVERERTTLPQD